MRMHFLTASILLVVFFAWSDPVLIQGTVTAGRQQPLAGAVVTAVVGSGQSIVTVADTTGETGEFQISLASSGRGTVMLSAAASGYIRAAATVTVDNPSDSVADSVGHDFTLQREDAGGDTVLISGVISDDAETPVAGALVQISFGMSTTVQEVTTDGNGAYRLLTVNTLANQNVVLQASAEGHQSAYATVRISAPRDGVTDTIARDLELVRLVFDTVIVSGVVVDDADDKPVAGATAIISWGGFTSQSADTLTANAQGIIAGKLLVTPEITRISWVILADGYQSQRGTATIGTNGAVDLDTVALTAYAVTDTIAYTVSGIVSNVNGTGIGGAQVIVTVSFQDAVILVDTTLSSNFGQRRGSYSVQTRQPYQAGELVVTVSVTAQGYEPGSEISTVATSVAAIGVDVVLQVEGTAIRQISRTAPKMEFQGPVSIYSINGRLIRTVDNRNVTPAMVREIGRAGGHQVMLVRWIAGGKPMCQRVLLH